jgi:hypothetical protein
MSKFTLMISLHSQSEAPYYLYAMPPMHSFTGFASLSFITVNTNLKPMCLTKAGDTC